MFDHAERNFMNLDFLKNNPNLKNMDADKLRFLMDFAAQNPTGDMKSMASVLMNASSSAKNKGVEFTSDETSILVELLKQNMSPEEQKKADQIMLLMNTMRKKK